MRHAHTTDTGSIVSTTSPLRYVRASKSLLLLQTTSERLPQYATRYVVYQFSPRYWAPSWSNLRALGFWQASPDSLILPSVAPEPLNFELTQHYEEGGPIVDVYGHLVGVKLNGKMASHSEMLGILHEEKSLLNWWMSNLAGRFRNTIGQDTVLSVQTSQINQVLDIDNYADADVIQQKIQLLRTYTKAVPKFYCFTGYDREGHWDADFWRRDLLELLYRIEILMRQRCLPYVMRYQRYEESPYRGMYITLARWCNQPAFFKKKSLREFVCCNGEGSASYRYLSGFERAFPEADYFLDLKFEEV